MSRFGVLFAVLGLVISGSAEAKILFVCGAPASGQHVSSGFERRSAEPVLVSATPNPAADDEGQIALVLDADGYDIRLHYGDRAERSLRDEGANILATSMGGAFIHVIVAREASEDAEHFLFSADHDGLGNLVWGAIGAADTQGSGADAGLDNKANCVQP